MPLPPGPRRPAALQTLAWTLYPTSFIDDCVRRFGDPFTIRLESAGDFVLVSSPELIKQVFTTDPEVLRAGEANSILLPIVGPSSVLLLDRTEHLRRRRLLLPPFHGERMQAYGEQMRDLTLRGLQRFPIGQPFAIHPYMQAITLDVILRTVFGIEEGSNMADFAEMLVEFFDPGPSIFVFFPQLQIDVPGSPYNKFLRRRERVDQEIRRIIGERRGSADAASRTDILSLLMNAVDEQGQPLSDSDLRDELVTAIVAGHETTATASSWAMERLVAHPDIAEKVHAELDEVVGDRPLDPEILPKLEYLDAFIKETLRLRPPIPIVARRVRAPYSLAGYDLPLGTTIAPCIYLTHRRPDLYPDPERFWPERFLGAKLDPYEYFPFGGGIRRCIGMSFALYELKMVLATVLSRARFRAVEPGGERIGRRAIVFAPARGGRVIMTSRR